MKWIRIIIFIGFLGSVSKDLQAQFSISGEAGVNYSTIEWTHFNDEGFNYILGAHWGASFEYQKGSLIYGLGLVYTTKGYDIGFRSQWKFIVANPTIEFVFKDRISIYGGIYGGYLEDTYFGDIDTDIDYGLQGGLGVIFDDFSFRFNYSRGSNGLVENNFRGTENKYNVKVINSVFNVSMKARFYTFD